MTKSAAAALAPLMQNPDEAAALFEGLLRTVKNNHDFTAISHNYAMLLKRQGKLDQAETTLKKVLQVFEEDPGGDYPGAEGGSRRLYAEILRAQGRVAEAKAHYKTALALQQERLGRTNPLVVDTEAHYEQLLEEAGDWREALARHQELLEIWRAMERTDSPGYQAGLLKTSRLMLSAGQTEEAVQAANRAVVSAELFSGYTPFDWIEAWAKWILAPEFAADKVWKGPALRANVWSALMDHLLETPGGSGFGVDAISWETLRFRLERWNAPEDYSLIGDGTLKLPDGVLRSHDADQVFGNTSLVTFRTFAAILAVYGPAPWRCVQRWP